MKQGPTRFEHYLVKLEQLFAGAASDSDPAAWLYKNGARTPIFMLEGLAKLYSGVHNKKRFAKIQKHFKLLEDGLGVIDYYDNFSKQFAADRKAPRGAAEFARKRADESTARLNELLRRKGWLKLNTGKLAKIRKKLKGADWLDQKDEVSAFRYFYTASIKDIVKFAGQYSNGFTELETQVHELRRRIRWLSIYPQALQGAIQLTKTSSRDKNVKKYLTPEITGSPFNKMPDVGDCAYILLFEKDYFLALSWMIAELGRLKDVGLQFAVLKEAGISSKGDDAAENKILADATKVCRIYFEEGSLEMLLNGIETVSPE